MYPKKQTNEEKLRILLDKIQGIRRIPISTISELADYNENYLSERMSSKGVSEKILKRVESLYERAMRNPTLLEQVEVQKNKSSIQIIEERGERLIALEAATTVLTAKIKELESIVTKRSSALVSLEVDKLMQDVLMQKLNELRKNNG